MKEVLHASCFLVTVYEPSLITQKNNSSSPENLPKTWHHQHIGPPPLKVESVGILGVESHFNSLDLVAQLDGGPQLQLHALLHGGKCQQQERLPVDVLPENRARLEPRQCAPRQGIRHGSLRPGAEGAGRAGPLSSPLSLERGQRAARLDGCLTGLSKSSLLKTCWLL